MNAANPSLPVHELPLGREAVRITVLLAVGLLYPALCHQIPAPPVNLGVLLVPLLLPVFMAAFMLPLRSAIGVAVAMPVISCMVSGMPPFMPPVAPILMLEGIAIVGAVAATGKWSSKWWVALIAGAAASRIVSLVCGLAVALTITGAAPGIAAGNTMLGIAGLMVVGLLMPLLFKLFKPIR